MATSFIPLHCHSSHSTGALLIGDLVKRAKRLGYEGMGIVDTNIFGMIDLFKVCDEVGIKPIVGAELDGLIIVVKDDAGYRNLCRLITAHNRGQRFDPIGRGLIYISRSLERLKILRDKIPDDHLFHIIRPYEGPNEFNPIATPEINSLDGDRQLLKVLGAIRNPGDIFKRKANRLLKPTRMVRGYHPAAVKNTRLILEMVDFRPEPRTGFPPFSGDLLQLLKGKIRHKKEQHRVEYELAIIRDYGCESIFLIVYHLFRFARSRGIATHLRGSAAASLILHLLGLSKVDPLRYGLPFERFLNPKRDEPPDIDIDVDYRYRDLLIGELIRICGKEYTARPAVINRFRFRGAFRAVALALGVPPDELKATEMHREEDLYKRISTIARRLVGHPYAYSVHPGGVVVSGRPILDLAPLYPSTDGEIVELDKDGLEFLKLAKIDILGVRGITQIEVLDIEPTLQDRPTFEIIRSGNTLGCFQIESPAMRQLMVRIKPNRIEDLMLALALIRPGADKRRYLDRLEGREEVRIEHPVLAETLGVLVYQEQVLEIGRRFAGLDWADADLLRKGISSHNASEWGRFYRIFKRSAQEVGRTDDEIERCWRLITRFASFGFNKAHSAGYGILAYLAAYAKVHRSVEFFRTLLSSHGGYYPLIGYIHEAQRQGVEILPPDINRSQIDFAIEGETIRTGLAEIRDLSKRTMMRIINHQPYSRIEEFALLVRPPVNELINLINSGASDSLPGSRGEKFVRSLETMRRRSLPLIPSIIPEIPEERSELEKMRILGFIPGHHPLEIVAPERKRKIGDLRPGDCTVITGLAISRRTIRTDHSRITFITVDDETGVLEIIRKGRLPHPEAVITAKGRFDGRAFQATAVTSKPMIRSV